MFKTYLSHLRCMQLIKRIEQSMKQNPIMQWIEEAIAIEAASRKYIWRFFSDKGFRIPIFFEERITIDAASRKYNWRFFKDKGFRLPS